MGRDGRIEAGDLEAVLGMAFGVDAKTAGESWGALKASCEGTDGRLKLSAVQAALTAGALLPRYRRCNPSLRKNLLPHLRVQQGHPRGEGLQQGEGE